MQNSFDNTNLVMRESRENLATIELNSILSCRNVESEILTILRVRHEDCVMFEGPDSKRKCADIYESYKQAEANWFCKCMSLEKYLSMFNII